MMPNLSLDVHSLPRTPRDTDIKRHWRRLKAVLSWVADLLAAQVFFEAPAPKLFAGLLDC